MATSHEQYPTKLEIEYPDTHNRLTSFFRIIWALPIMVILGLLSSSGSETYTNTAGKEVTESGMGIAGGLFIATALMIVFRQRYPKWWFDFALEFTRFGTRVGAYLFLLTDKYPSTEDHQSVDLDVNYPDAKKLDGFLPLVKWFLAIPHYFVLAFLIIGALFATIIAWFAILFTGRYPRSLFDYVVHVGQWCLRVNAYAFLLVTDKYPPFRLK